MRLGDALAAENSRDSHGGRTPGGLLCSLPVTCGVAAAWKAMRPATAPALGEGRPTGWLRARYIMHQPSQASWVTGLGRAQAAGSDRVCGAGWERDPQEC